MHPILAHRGRLLLYLLAWLPLLPLTAFLFVIVGSASWGEAFAVVGPPRGDVDEGLRLRSAASREPARQPAIMRYQAGEEGHGGIEQRALTAAGFTPQEARGLFKIDR